MGTHPESQRRTLRSYPCTGHVSGAVSRRDGRVELEVHGGPPSTVVAVVVNGACAGSLTLDAAGSGTTALCANEAGQIEVRLDGEVILRGRTPWGDSGRVEIEGLESRRDSS